MLFQEAVTGQNLVVNPSFEKVTEIVPRWSGTYAIFNRRMVHWESPTQGSPDILFIKLLDKMMPKRDKVDLSGYEPRTGKFMLGLRTYGCKNGVMHCKEYIQIKLTEPLQFNQDYYFEFWVQPISTSVKVNGMGILLTTERQEDLMNDGLIELYPMVMNEEVIGADSSSWQKISGEFKADQRYEYLTVGNFLDDGYIEFKSEPDGLEYGYYLLDDVLLRPLNGKTPEPPPPPPKQTTKLKTNEVLVLENILFEFDKAILQDVSKPQLHELIEYLKSNDRYQIEIRGHTDAIGTTQRNQELSEQRANTIKNYLTTHGIQAQRVHPVGFGSSIPLAPNDSEDNRKINRRVEIKITETK